MTWLLVLGGWTLCGALAAPVIGRILAQHDGDPRPRRRPLAGRPLPTPGSPLILR